MHELSIALNILEIAEEESEQRGNTAVEAIHVKLGAMSGVVKDALLFSYEVACQDTPLAGSKLVQVQDMSNVLLLTMMSSLGSVAQLGLLLLGNRVDLIARDVGQL